MSNNAPPTDAGKVAQRDLVDVFISYAHIDNQPLDADQQGWITELNRRLKIRLSEFLGEDAKIWRDPKLGGNDEFAAEIEEKLRSSKILVSVLSPRYIKSDWCRRELHNFYEAYQQKNALKVNNKYRIFNVIKLPIPLERYPEEVRPMLGFEFFEQDPSTGRTNLYEPDLGKDNSIKFQLKLDDMAREITELLENLQDAPRTLENTDPAGTSSPSPGIAGKTIFLAETSSDLNDQRDTVKRELQQRGYAVLPDTAIPYVSPACEQAIEAMLDRCCLSIHLIGGRYGLIPEGASQSIVALQVDLAAKRSDRSPPDEEPFQTLLWMPRDLKNTEPQQQAFIAALLADPHLVQTTLESFKTIALETLEGKAQANKRSDQGDDQDAATIYLLFDKEDVDAIQPTYDHLLDQGFNVVYPGFDGEEGEDSEEHQANLCDCDGVLIYYGAGKERWLKAKLLDLRKAPGYGRIKPFLARAVVLAPPQTPQKKMLRSRPGEPALIDAFDGSVESLAPFLAGMRQPSTGQSP
jgi:hypothetical protein